MASAAILVHTPDNMTTKGKSSQPKSNQHQLAPINQPRENPNTGDTDYNGGHRGRGAFTQKNLFNLLSCGEFISMSKGDLKKRHKM